MTSSDFTPGVELHDELNPLLWKSNGQLDQRVRKALLKIAREFYEFLNVPVNVVDVIITGSQTAYSYTASSDLDLHLVVPYKMVQCDQPVHELFDTKRKLWKENHKISIHGIPVELYAEDTDKPVNGHSYSLIRGEWVHKPKMITQPIPPGVERTTKAWITLITNAVRSGDIEKMQSVKNKLMTYRQASLNKSGEMGKGNIVFKTLRNSGAISMLMKSLTHAQDQALSLPE